MRADPKDIKRPRPAWRTVALAASIPAILISAGIAEWGSRFSGAGEFELRDVPQLEPGEPKAVLHEAKGGVQLVTIPLEGDLPTGGEHAVIFAVAADGSKLPLAADAAVERVIGNEASVLLNPSEAVFIYEASKFGNFSAQAITAGEPSPYRALIVRDIFRLKTFLRSGLAKVGRELIKPDTSPESETAREVAKVLPDAETESYIWATGSPQSFVIDRQGKVYAIAKDGTRNLLINGD